MQTNSPSPRVPSPAPIVLKVTSKALTNGAPMRSPQVFTGAGGGNISPDLAWEAGPVGTKCYAVTCFDPDAPTGSGWWHWVLVNIPHDVLRLEAGQVPKSALPAPSDYGTLGYGGACPPEGDGAHRYIFTVYALKSFVSEEALATAAMAAFHIHASKLAEGLLTVTYAR